MTPEPQPPRPAASTAGPDDADARAEEQADRVADERTQQELDYAELGGEG